MVDALDMVSAERQVNDSAAEYLKLVDQYDDCASVWAWSQFIV